MIERPPVDVYDAYDAYGELPEWFDAYRPHQLVAVGEIMRAFADGARVVVMEAPTGSGKTLIAETVRRQMRPPRTVYTTPVKHLQDQFARDYPYARVLKGRSNYPTLQENLYGPPLWVSAADCDKKSVDNGDGTKTKMCSYCGDMTGWCPYEVAKADAAASPLAVVNTAYLLTEANYLQERSWFFPADLVIVDEADVLEAELMRFIGLEMTKRQVERYGLGEPAHVTKPEAWVDWCEQAVRRLAEYRVKESDPIKRAREVKRVQEFREKISSVRVGILTGDWVYTGKNGSVSFKPVRVTDFGTDVLWNHGTRWLLMSATIVSAKTLVEDELGYTGKWDFVSVGSTFPAENRPIYIDNVADMGRKGRDNGADDVLIAEILRLLERHPDERVLIHTVSYNLADKIVGVLGQLPRFIYTYMNARERDEALADYLMDPTGVLVASSMDRGVDLPDDACRVVIVAKIPYGNLGDRQVSARLYGSKGGKTWYAVNTVRSLIQMLGRGVRHEDDHATSYILDAAFKRLWGEWRGLFPEYVREAMAWQVPNPEEGKR